MILPQDNQLKLSLSASQILQPNISVVSEKPEKMDSVETIGEGSSNSLINSLRSSQFGNLTSSREKKPVSGLITSQLRKVTRDNPNSLMPNNDIPYLDSNLFSFRLLNGIQYPIVIADGSSYSIVYINDAFRKLFGFGHCLPDDLNMNEIFPKLRKKFGLSKWHKKFGSVGNAFHYCDSYSPVKKSSVSPSELHNGISRTLQARKCNGTPVAVELTLSNWNPSLETNLILGTVKENLDSSRSHYLSEFEELSVIGKGGHGVVVRARNKLDGNDYAVKKISIKTSKKFGSHEKVIEEVKAFAKISNHPNIIRYYSAWVEEDSNINDDSSFYVHCPSDPEVSDEEFLANSVSEQMKFLYSDKAESYKDDQRKPKQASTLYIQMQLCDHQDLRQWIDCRTNVNKFKSFSIMKQIVAAVSFIHSKGYFHGDLKPSNIYVQDDDLTLVGDFGLTRSISKSLSQPKTTVDYQNDKGTFLYIPPEGKISVQGDIFALGIIFIELLIAFKTSMERAVVLKNVKQGILPDDLRKFPKESPLLSNMLSLQAKSRPSSEMILSLIQKWIVEDQSPSISGSSLDAGDYNPNFLEWDSKLDGSDLTAGLKKRWSSNEMLTPSSPFPYSLSIPRSPSSFINSSYHRNCGTESERIKELEIEVESLKSEVDRLRMLLEKKETAVTFANPTLNTLRSSSRGILF